MLSKQFFEAINQHIPCVLVLLDPPKHASGLCVTSSGGVQANPGQEFHAWVLEHEKAYVSDEAEYSRRFSVWMQNLDFSHEYNQKHTTHWVRLSQL